MFWLVNSFPSSPVWYLRFFSLFKEKDDSGSGCHGSWLDLASDNRTCEWCSAPDDMKNHLPSYVKVPLDNWHKDLLLDLCYCFDCVQEYHRLQEELDHESKKVFMLHCSIDSTCSVHCIFVAMIRFKAQGIYLHVLLVPLRRLLIWDRVLIQDRALISFLRNNWMFKKKL